MLFSAAPYLLILVRAILVNNTYDIARIVYILYNTSIKQLKHLEARGLPKNYKVGFKE
ncbi:hypothetical protein PYJP_07820 [Pyrofollis japonicus]|nr:hypothetical protein PYJP_07820 [Pyrofollis japonicus]